MRKFIVIIAAVFVGISAMVVSFAPDVLALMVIALICLVVFLGFIMGIMPTLLYGSGFLTARQTMQRLLEVSTTAPWLALQQLEYLFHQGTLDHLFAEYKNKVNRQQKEGAVCSDIEEVINEDVLALRSWQSVMLQLPGTLTALGLLGTFIGLITGISGIGFSSVDAAISSIELLLSGIQIAFYTSIVGVVYSILFNIIYKLTWNAMLRQMGLFMEEFHLQILPRAEEQSRQRRHEEMKMVIERLDRLPKQRGYSMAMGNQLNVDYGTEQRMMPEIREGLKNGEFTFYVQPRCDLNNRTIIAGEALMRWNHKEAGLVSPGDFIPIVEANGFVVKLDTYIWEQVCKTIRGWIDAGLRPIPLSVNVSKTDILAVDVVGFFNEMIRKYRIPPRYLEIEIAENAYLQSASAVQEVEMELRQSGFRVILDGFDGDFVVLNTMKDFEADALKLDLRFTADNGKNTERIEHILDQARKIHMPILSAGIETTEQFDILRKSGCAEGQGYYLYRPMEVSEFEKHIGRL